MYFGENHQQISFNPVDYHFEWTNDWYTWNREQAIKDARKARSAKAKQLRKDGWNVRLWSLSNQRITRGGIGSGHPEITAIVSVYYINATR